MEEWVVVLVADTVAEEVVVTEVEEVAAGLFVLLLRRRAVSGYLVSPCISCRARAPDNLRWVDLSLVCSLIGGGSSSSVVTMSLTMVLAVVVLSLVVVVLVVLVVVVVVVLLAAPLGTVCLFFAPSLISSSQLAKIFSEFDVLASTASKAC